MSARGNAAVKPIGVDPSKLEAIKQGKKLKSETGATQNKKVTVTKSGDKIIAVEKEKKFEEAGVTRKKRNYVMYESKLGTEKETDLTQIKAPPKPKKVEVKPRVEEKVIMKKKKIEYLDNYQYKETKEFRKADKGSIVIHERLGGPIGGSYEETSYQKITTTTGAGAGAGGALKGAKTTTTTTTTKTEKTTGTASGRSQSRGAANNREGAGETTATATKEMVSTTKVGRRGGAGGATSTTTESTTKTTTTRTTRRGK
jgi:hypothetical protein